MFAAERVSPGSALLISPGAFGRTEEGGPGALSCLGFGKAHAFNPSFPEEDCCELQDILC